MIPRQERAAFDAFVTTYSDRLVRSAYLLCGDRRDAEDLVQIALMRTARQWRRARESPEAYARRVVVNLAKDRWRGLRRRPAELPLEVDVQAPDTTRLVDRDMILRAAQQLPAGQRAVLVLRYFDDLSVESTAAALGCTTGTVKSQTARALDNLRAALIPTRGHADADR
ncbi:SigE family RNA polymerase sigma factor [Pseudonocardia sp. MH-G8]|uniref:SigE family RNA polymerase sigma factor n=1 Tax=Pseudonocardia sp. MH-G8 TaxID=1854588 RepID=UPI000BA0EE26|nr:SigE family RNA polymerase sigma factor [Pseudonocardia sp. MH-G8]OZM83549.1 SigE family RNA polymerase sigma factor [Pseudonocardia sp. MH-G8]